MTPTGRMDDLTAIVTGGTQGIGEAVVRRFVENGAHVVIVARTQEPGRAIVDELGADRAVFVQGDVAEGDVADRAVQAAVEAFGGLDVLVNNAGIDFAKAVLDTSESDVERVLAVNYVGAFKFLQSAAAEMRQRGGSIVNVVSRTANVGVPTMGTYGASKGALLSLTRAAALEFAPFGIRVNAVAPGMTDTPLIRAWIADQDNPSAFEKEMAKTVPLNRLATPDDVAGAVLFLAGSDSTYITGACIPVDGGYTAA